MTDSPSSAGLRGHILAKRGTWEVTELLFWKLLSDAQEAVKPWSMCGHFSRASALSVC